MSKALSKTKLKRLTLLMSIVVPTALSPFTQASMSYEHADTRAKAAVAKMTLDEKLSFLSFSFADAISRRNGAVGSAGFIPGISRLGIPPLQISDASLGVANPAQIRQHDRVTALPSSIALGATFDPALAEQGGKVIGHQAYEKGFNLLLAGGSVVIRDALNGRNFEYISEDPLLTGIIAGHAIRGIQSTGTISSMKHFAINTQETGRVLVSSDLNEKAMREVDLLAFQLALEIGKPGAVMPGYNRVNGDWATENTFLLNKVLKQQWQFPGWVISDWGSTHSTVKAANAGLDQQAAYDFDTAHFFGKPLQQAVARGDVSAARIDDMVTRILRTMFQITTMKPGPKTESINLEKDNQIAQRQAEEGIVLIKNQGNILPLSPEQRILVVGGEADRGVLSGGGSSQVLPDGSFQLPGDQGPADKFPQKWYHPSSPLKALQHALPKSTISFNNGEDSESLLHAAKQADTIIVFATQWTAESEDVPNLSLSNQQDQLIDSLVKANSNVVVVLETGGAVLMPWANRIKGIIAAWYPGSRGGEAIAAILSGKTNPSGHLPITFPRDESQLPVINRPDPNSVSSVPNGPLKGQPFSVDYRQQGVNVGYRWFEKQQTIPLFAFGHGLSYTQFSRQSLGARLNSQHQLILNVAMKNIGTRSGNALAQFYIRPANAEATWRLAGWQKLILQPGEQREASITVDPRIIGEWDQEKQQWHIAARTYEIRSADNALASGLTTQIELPASDYANAQFLSR